MPKPQNLRQFLDVISYQILATRNYLRHFKTGIEKEFLPEEPEVQKDWELNTYSLVFLVGPAYAYMQQNRTKATSEIAQHIELNMSRLKVLQADLASAYQTYCSYSDPSSTGSAFSNARPWVMSDVEQAIYRCNKWLQRIQPAQPNDTESLNNDSMNEWCNISGGDLPASARELSDLAQRVTHLNKLVHGLSETKPTADSLQSEILSQNPLLQVCMASRRLVITLLFLTLTQRQQATESNFLQAKNCLQNALNAIAKILPGPQLPIGQKTQEGIKLLEHRLKHIEAFLHLQQPIELNGSEHFPATAVLKAERNANHDSKTPDELLILSM